MHHQKHKLSILSLAILSIALMVGCSSGGKHHGSGVDNSAVSKPSDNDKQPSNPDNKDKEPPNPNDKDSDNDGDNPDAIYPISDKNDDVNEPVKTSPAAIKNIIAIKDFASRLSSDAADNIIITIDGKLVTEIDFAVLAGGRDQVISKEIVISDGNSQVEGKMRFYQQKYSLVYGTNYHNQEGDLIPADGMNRFVVDGFIGQMTTKSAIANLINNKVTANYTGTAFDGENAGTLSYTIDFATQTGHGSITGLSVGDIVLTEGNIDDIEGGLGISSETIVKGESNGYELGIFGDKAEEIAGKVRGDGSSLDNEIGFAGSITDTINNAH